MTTAASTLRNAIVTAIRASSAAAAQAGLTPAAWGDTVTPHVFHSDGAPMAHKNRGRIPFIELIMHDVPYGHDVQGGGTITSNMTLRVHVGGSSKSTAEDQAGALLGICLAAMRDTTVTNYLGWGVQVVKPFHYGPLWHTQDCDFTVEHSYDQTTFEVQ